MAGDFSMSCSTDESAFMPEIRVVVLGDAKVGKTSLLRQYLHHEKPSRSTGYESTLLDSYTHVDYCGTQPYRLIFTDCSSAPSFHEHRAAYLAKCDVVILVYSARHRKTLLNLRHWMEEVLEARGLTGPARCASTTGDFGEVPIFVVGTHYREKDSSEATNPTSTDEAESITKECLQSAGYFINENDADTEEALRSNSVRSQKAQQRRQQRQGPKERRSPRAFHDFLHKLFHSNADGEGRDAATLKKATSDEVTACQQHQPASPVSNNGCLSPASSTPMLPQVKSDIANDKTKSSNATSTLRIPPGASTRLPLFQLSNTDGKAVDMAVRAALTLHLWLQRHEGDSVALSAAHTPHSSSATASKPEDAAAQSAPPHESSKSADDGAGAAIESTAEPLTVPPATLHAHAISSASHMSYVSERSVASFIPPMLALYNVGVSGSVCGESTETPTLRHSRGVSYVMQTAGSSPSAAQQPPQANSITEPSRESAFSCCGNGSSEVTMGASNEGKATDQRALGEVCSQALERRGKRTEDRAPSYSSNVNSVCKEGKKDDAAHPGHLQESMPKTAALVSSSELGGTAASGASIKAGELMKGKTHSCLSLPDTISAAAPDTDSREANGVAGKVGGKFSTISGPMMPDGALPLSTAPSSATSLRADAVTGDGIVAVSQQPTLRVRKEMDVGKEGDGVGTGCCGDRPTRKSEPVTKLPLECEPDSDPNSFPMLRRSRENGSAGVSAVRAASAEPLASSVHTTNNRNNAPFAAKLSPRDECVSSRSPYSTPNTGIGAVKNEAAGNKSAQEREPVALPRQPRPSSAAREPKVSQSEPSRPQKGRQTKSKGKRDPKHHRRSATSTRILIGRQQKQKTTQCIAGGCAGM
ncbi:putative ras-like small GTPases [Leishmania infantum JPCM5]|uniref:Ras-like_small_GTPases_-_putative n=2 Tax=Leishmania infantum TaxID=5671 RepID=A0A6L0XRL3_LEIIN|nr:putative ras-like small GTPases [Leishmania infantum JPCM5]CAC9549934.1 ras-like_small_GTPases_-_putative [Leishmania infantum]CAM72884.1 putative ras-like small GTPases [Leishmania infantum JPCM5]SUZ46562.1 ras-like_small_GTPases_-_putative [Leishmania infantum]|eukprot:XP_001469772.1 putative ras-like small GTPases [Leishmania infantum JPCM5]